ncbi:MAG: hypothetical protein D6681_08920 [Calditrichaeota bacterium]|nr:MAG: hypothetical protein D6681_08920 [Calditrichota bacterium]
MSQSSSIEELLKKIDDPSIDEKTRIEYAYMVAEQAPLYQGYAHRLDHLQQHARDRGETHLAKEIGKAATRLRERHRQ